MHAILPGAPQHVIEVRLSALLWGDHADVLFLTEADQARQEVRNINGKKNPFSFQNKTPPLTLHRGNHLRKYQTL